MATAPLLLTEVVGHLPYASNTTLLAKDDADLLWVYKPTAGERPLWDFPWQTLAAREVLTFETSAAMGFEVVPETLLAEGPYGPGSAQRFLDEDETWDPRPLLGPPVDAALWPVAVLDMVVNNADRKLGHVLRETGSARLLAIDHGLTFHVEAKLRTVLWGFAGRPFPDAMIAAVARLDEALSDHLRHRAAALLSPEEADALVDRVHRILDDPVHPFPPRDRPPVPWPVW